MARLIALLAMLFFVSAAHSAPTCLIITQQLAPCITFVKGVTEDPSLPCCNGARELSGTVHSSQDKREVCLCLKDTLSKIGIYKPSTLSLLPKKCGLNLDLPPIDQNTDCSRAALDY